MGRGAWRRTEALAPLKETFDTTLRIRLAHLSFRRPRLRIQCLRRWCWCDALFMSPPAWSSCSPDRRSPLHGIRDAEFWATTDFLYDPAEQLFFRDSRFFERRDDRAASNSGAAATAGCLPASPHPRLLPKDDPTRPIEGVPRNGGEAEGAAETGRLLAALLASARRNSPPEPAAPASTFTARLGHQRGFVRRSEYEPRSTGWHALARAVQADGRLGWVQQVSDRPKAWPKRYAVLRRRRVPARRLRHLRFVSFASTVTLRTVTVRAMNIKAGSLLALALLASTTSNDSCAQDATPLPDSFRKWKPIIDARMRAEFVDQTPFVEDADAGTLRLRAGFETGKAWDTTLLAEGEFVDAVRGRLSP